MAPVVPSTRLTSSVFEARRGLLIGFLSGRSESQSESGSRDFVLTTRQNYLSADTGGRLNPPGLGTTKLVPESHLIHAHGAGPLGET